MEDRPETWPNEGMTEHTTPQSEAPEAPQAPEATQHEAPYRRRLERREEGKWIAGVATGLAEYFAVPVWLVRILFLFLLPAGGTAIFLYLALVVFMPTEFEDESLAERWFGSFNVDGNRERTIGIGLAAIAGIVLLASATSLDGGVIVALALLGVGVILYQGGPGRSEGSPAAPVAEEALDGDGEAVDTGNEARPPRPPAPPTARRSREPRPPKAPKPRQPKSNLFAYTFAAILFAEAGLATLDITDVLYPDAFHYVALAVAIVGTGLLVGAWRGRSRGLFFLGLALLPFLAVTWVTGNVDQIVAEWESGNEDILRNEIVLVDEVNGLERIDLGVGEATIDLTDTVFVGDAELRITMDAGQLTVIVPDDVRVRADVDLGAIDRPSGIDAEGIDVAATYGPALADADAYVRVSLDLGEIIIEEGN